MITDAVCYIIPELEVHEFIPPEMAEAFLFASEHLDFGETIGLDWTGELPLELQIQMDEEHREMRKRYPEYWE